MHSFTGAYSNIAFVTILFIIIATPPWCYSSFLPEYTIVSPVLVILLKKKKDDIALCICLGGNNMLVQSN